MIDYSVDKDALKTQFYILCGVGLVLGIIIGSFLYSGDKNHVNKSITVLEDDPSQSNETEIGPTYGLEMSMDGYLSDGNKKYAFTMFLRVDGNNEVEGYYRYLSKPKNAIIELSGSVRYKSTGGTGVYATTKHFSLTTKDGKEKFSFVIDPGKDTNLSDADGEWFLFDSRSDAYAGKTSKRLAIHIESYR